jgi:hypothetical protein
MDRDRITHVAADGPLLRTGADALELIFADDADLLVVPAERLDPAFFDLSSGVAGEFAQKFVNYRKRLAIVGDISAAVDGSGALRDFVRESNRGRQLWFVADDAELTARLTG